VENPFKNKRKFMIEKNSLNMINKYLKISSIVCIVERKIGEKYNKLGNIKKEN